MHVFQIGVFQSLYKLKHQFTSSAASLRRVFKMGFCFFWRLVSQCDWSRLNLLAESSAEWLAVWVRWSTWEMPRELLAIVLRRKPGPSSVCLLKESHLCHFTQHTITPPQDEPIESTAYSFTPVVWPCVQTPATVTTQPIVTSLLIET